MDLGDGVVSLAAMGFAVAAVGVAVLQQRKLSALSDETRLRGARALALQQVLNRGPIPQLAVNLITGEVAGLTGARKVLGLLPEALEADGLADALAEAVEPTHREDLRGAVTALRTEGADFDLVVTAEGNSPKTLKVFGQRLNFEANGDPGEPLVDVIWIEDLGAAADIVSHDGLNQLPVPVWSRRRDGTVGWLNGEAMKLFGEDGRDLMSDTLLKLGRRAAERSIDQTSSHVAIREGERRLLEVIETPFADRSGTLGTAFDMTDIADAQAALDRQIDVHDQVLESLDVGIFVFDSDKRLRFFNRALLDILKIDQATLRDRPKIGEFLERLRDHRVLPEVVDFPAFKRAWEANFTKTLEPAISLEHLPDGRTLKQTILPHPQGGILCMLEDATDRLALERSFNTLTDVQRATLDNLREGAALFGEDHRLKLYNPAWANLWHLTPEQLEGEPHFNDIVDMTKPLVADEDSDWERQRGRMIGILAERQTHMSQYTRPDGVVITSNWVPLPDGATLLTQMDISDTVKFQKALTERAAALEAADRMKSAFIANISYDLRTPLTAIVGFADILEAEYFGPLNERQKQYAQAIRSSSDRLSSLINDMLDLASLEAGYLELKFAEAGLAKMVSEAVDLIGERARSLGIKIVVEGAGDDPTLQVDPQRIIQALFNVLDNAINETPTGQRITILTSALDDADPPMAEVKIVYTLDLDQAASADESGSPEGGDPAAPWRSRSRRRDMFADLDDAQSGGALSLALVRNLVEIHGGEATSGKASGKTADVTGNAWVRIALPLRQRSDRAAGETRPL
ncbi:MAG: PAS-domain containing protein [Alphaproteobacteria bacterium]|nr:PAS-domain containing protein [Alphaproteobacteria bacterium]